MCIYIYITSSSSHLHPVHSSSPGYLLGSPNIPHIQVSVHVFPLPSHSLSLHYPLASPAQPWGFNLFINSLEDNSLNTNLVRCPFHVQRTSCPAFHSTIILASPHLLITYFPCYSPQLVGRYHSFCSSMFTSSWPTVNTQKLLNKWLTFNNLSYLYFFWNLPNA